jgi:predicted dithiol-disulfide oxidoreductase (DUF899 family)
MATKHRVVSADDWLKARKRLLAKEKKFQLMQDAMSAARRKLPWVRVSKPYVYEGSDGEVTLADLFDGRSQLVVYHFMFTSNSAAGCPHCSLRADSFNSINVHLKNRDVTLVAISRAPFKKLAAYRKRMGWSFPWVSSGDTDFNRSNHPGTASERGTACFFGISGAGSFTPTRVTRVATNP